MPTAAQTSLILALFWSTAFSATAFNRDCFTTFFLQGFLNDFVLESPFGIHLLQSPVFIFKLFQSSHQRSVHTTVFSSPFKEGRRTYAMFTAQYWPIRARFGLFEYANYLPPKYLDNFKQNLLDQILIENPTFFT